MPAKQDRMVQHIIDSEMAKGKDRETAESIAWGHVQNLKTAKKRFFPDRAQKKRLK